MIIKFIMYKHCVYDNTKIVLEQQYYHTTIKAPKHP